MNFSSGPLENGEGARETLIKSDNDLISVSLVLRAFHPLTADESSARIRNEELGIRNEGGGFAANIYGAMPA